MAIYTVSQVAAYLKDSLELDPVLSDVMVEGEVSNLRTSAAGHSYFNLKDRQSILNCVMFRGQAGAELLREGVSLAAHGHLTFYEPRGSLNFMVDLAMPGGVGELAMEFERLKRQLEAEGLFDASRKRPLPLFPAVIGVVTSPAGAVFHDIQNVLRRRYPLVEILLSPTLVQGEEAALQIAAAIERLSRDGRADVIIVARGGGSLEDLRPFNEEMVARAIYASRIPLVSAVGHETDVTIADLVADVRAPTPSAAAELVVPDRITLLRNLLEHANSLIRGMDYQLRYRRSQISELSGHLERGLPDLKALQRPVDDLAAAAQNAMSNRLKLARMQVEGLERQLRALEPAAVLRRGFAVVEKTECGEVVSSPSQVTDGEKLTLTVMDGSIAATVGVTSSPATARKKIRTPRSGIYPELMERLL